MEQWREDVLVHYGVKGMKWGKHKRSEAYEKAYSRLVDAIDQGADKSTIANLQRTVNTIARMEDQQEMERLDRFLEDDRQKKSASSDDESDSEEEKKVSKKGKSSGKKSGKGKGGGGSSSSKEIASDGKDVIDRMFESGLVSEVKDSSGNLMGYMKYGNSRIGVAERIKQKVSATKAALEARLRSSSKSSSSSSSKTSSSKKSDLSETVAKIDSKAEQERKEEKSRISAVQKKAQDELRAKMDAKRRAEQILKIERGY